MTDRPPASGEPSTEAGRALLNDESWGADMSLRDAILAIEAEARAALSAQVEVHVEHSPTGERKDRRCPNHRIEGVSPFCPNCGVTA
jgi:hypothetical protein